MYLGNNTSSDENVNGCVGLIEKIIIKEKTATAIPD